MHLRELPQKKSVPRLADYGFDAETGIWAECPGYSSVVINDYANFANLIRPFLERPGIDCHLVGIIGFQIVV